MATAADYVIAEVEHLVELGEIPPDQVHTPGIYVDAIFQGARLREAHRKANRAQARLECPVTANGTSRPERESRQE